MIPNKLILDVGDGSTSLADGGVFEPLVSLLISQLFLALQMVHEVCMLFDCRVLSGADRHSHLSELMSKPMSSLMISTPNSTCLRCR